MSSGRIHAGGIPPQTQRKIELRWQELLTENAETLQKAGRLRRWKLSEALKAQAFREVTGCEMAQWSVSQLDESGIH
jgi:hypothetical protein